MAKLGYTWYPKDWGNSEAVFELDLEQRGLYRELIDMAMLNDNKTIIKLPIWCRKWNINEDKLSLILDVLEKSGLIQINFDESNELFIPSCENRLKMVRGGSSGGKKSKPTSKGNGKCNSKGSSKPTGKGNSNQREKKVNIKEIEREKELIFNTWLSYRVDFGKEIKIQSTIDALIKVFNRESLTKCEWVINHSVENGYQGLFWDKYTVKSNFTKQVSKTQSPIL